MQRAILRLSLAYHGKNHDLDRKLKEFGLLVRSGRRQAERQQLIDEIVDTIVSLDLDPGHAADAAGDSAGAEGLGHFLRCLRVPDTLQPEIERAQRALRDGRDKALLLALLGQTADALSQNLMRSPESCGDAPTIRMLLLELLETIPVTPALVERVSPLRRSIEAADRVDGFIGSIQGIGTLVNGLQNELRGELDAARRFLRETDLRLREFEKFVQRSRELHVESNEDALQLSDAVSGEIDALRSDAAETSSLEELKNTIEARLDTIGSGLNTFVATQKLRTFEANESIDRMKRRLHELEAQAENLREDLEQQHARVLVDPLTGVLNRTGYMETATKQVARWKRYGGALSLAVIDLDRFKQINDEYGHTAGDRVLSTVASKLTELVRQSDILCRYGGEEFVLLLPETGLEQGYLLLEKLRHHIERCPFRHKDTPVKVSISCGLAEFQDGDSLEAVFERADRAMYRAKQGGRNRICQEHELLEPPLSQTA
ncbi:MAG: diguanylate cyclase [Gammaproteobacteria bacterium]